MWMALKVLMLSKKVRKQKEAQRTVSFMYTENTH